MKIYPVFPKPGPGGPNPPDADGTLLMIQTNPYVWLYAIDLPTDPGTKLRLAQYHETVYFERTSLNVPIAYVPFSISHGDVRTDSEGSIPTVTMSAQNVTREMAALLEAYGYLIGQTVRIALVRVDEMPDGIPRLDDRFDILDAEVSEQTASFTLGRAALQSKSFPDHRITRDYCTAHYGSALCGYDTNRVGALQTCAKTQIDCEAHGDDEVAATLTRKHPQRFRSFPGVQRQGGTGVA